LDLKVWDATTEGKLQSTSQGWISLAESSKPQISQISQIEESHGIPSAKSARSAVRFPGATDNKQHTTNNPPKKRPPGV
jgi:hypothetical protein